MDTTIRLIDVFGQFENQGTDHYYTYLPSGQEAPTGWRNVMKDPRNEVSADLQQCYVAWCTSTDWWIAKMVRNPHDSRGGFAMLSVCLGANRPLDGGKAVKVLDSFAQFFIVEKHWVSEDSEKALINYGQDLDLVPCELRKFVEPTAALNSSYRSFESFEALCKCLSFLPQPGYENYSRIYFVPKEESARMPIPCLDSALPLRNMYLLEFPEDCTPSPIKSEIMDGEKLKLVYKKEGLLPIEKEITGGNFSECAYIDGNIMRIKSGKEMKLVHNRAVEIICKYNETRIEKFTLSNYTRQNNAIIIDGHKVVFPDETSQEVIVRIDTFDDKFEQAKVNLTEVKTDRIEVNLESKRYKVVFKMNNKKFETTTMMAPSEAKTLWSAYDSEIDDLNRIIYFRAHKKPAKNYYEEDHDEEESMIARIGRFFKRWWYYILAMLILLYGIYAIYMFARDMNPWPFGEKTEVKTVDASGGESQKLTQPEPEVTQPIVFVDTVSVMEEKDIEYLKNSDEWSKGGIQSNKFQALYDAITSGDVSVVVQESNSLFGEGVAVNGYFSRIVEGCRDSSREG